MKKLLYCFCLSLCLFSCQKETKDPDPIICILPAQVDCTCDPYIEQYTWRGETVYMKGFAGPACNWIPSYLHADGTPLLMPANYSLMDFKNEAVFVKRVWLCNGAGR